mgnify:CR=1 FL=1
MKKGLTLVLAIIMAISLVGCSSKESSTTSTTQADNAQTSAADISDTKKELQRLTIGAAGTGGTFYIWGAGVSSVLNSKYPEEFDINVMASGGPAQNCELLHQGEVELGFVTSFVASDYYNGTGIANSECSELRTLFPMYNSYLHIFSLADPDLTKLSDMNGKVVATGTPGGSSQIVGDAIIEELGYTPSSISPISLTQVMDNMKDGQCDIGMAVSNYPVSSLVELQATHPFQLIQMTDDELAKLKATNAGYGEGMIPAGTYTGQTEDYNTLSFFTLCLVTSEMDEDMAYKITKYIFESLPELGEAVGNVSEVIAESVLASPIPIHPGAARYYREVGVTIPDDMVIK